MKKLIPIFVCVILFSACQQTKQGIVKDLLDAENSFEKEKVNQLLSDSFMFYGPVTLNKDAYLSRVDSLKSIECLSTILKIQVLDSIVKTEEQERSIIDSLLEVTPAIIRYKTYRFVFCNTAYPIRLFRFIRLTFRFVGLSFLSVFGSCRRFWQGVQRGATTRPIGDF